MRFGKKTNIADTKKTRSCVVRLEKVSQASPSPPPQAVSQSTSSSAAPSSRSGKYSFVGENLGMGATSKQPTTGSVSSNKGRPLAKRLGGVNTNSKVNTPQQHGRMSTNNGANMPSSSVRTNQKIKAIPRGNRIATPQASAVTVRDDTPTPTIAAGRSRRAIKPNPKYASEDMVTPKMMRNVGVSKTSGANNDAARYRKSSTSSDDFYNNKSDDDYDYERASKKSSKHDDMDRDKAYNVDEKEEAIDLDSDISEIEEALTTVRPARVRGRPRKQGMNTVQNNASRTSSQQTTVKRSTNAAVLPVRTAPTQLQQLRRSLASANAQRNQSLLSGSGSSVAQKRRLDESLDSEDSETSYTVARKQIIVSSSTGSRVRVPVKESAIISSSSGGNVSVNRNRVLGVQKVGANSSFRNHSINGKPLNAQIIERRRLMEPSKKSISIPSKTVVKSTTLSSAASVHENKTHEVTPVRINKAMTPAAFGSNLSSSNKAILGNNDGVKNRMRTSSPRPSVNKESLNNSSKTLTPSPAAGFTVQPQKKLPTLGSKSLEKPKTAPTNTNTSASQALSRPVNSRTTKPSQQQQNTSKSLTLPVVNASSSDVLHQDESPNSTMDDFETMPTFTIVNVNDIINKKGDVLITKSKTSPENVPKTTVIEFSESISLDEDDGDDDYEARGSGSKFERVGKKSSKVGAGTAVANKISPISGGRLEHNKFKKSQVTARNSNEAHKRQTLTEKSSTSTAPVAKPQILNHKLGLRNNQRVTAKTTATVTPAIAPEKPAPRILNSVVAKRTEPVKPMIANMDDSAEESFPLSMDEEETEDEAESKAFGTSEKKAASYSLDLDTDDTESQNTEPDEPPAVPPPKALAPKNNSTANISTSPSPQSAQRKKRPPNSNTAPIVVSNKKRILTPAAAKENSLAATNQQANDSKVSSSLVPQARKPPAEKVVISKQGDKIIKKITCFETWYVINMPLEPKRQSIIRNQLDIPLIKLANNAKFITLPSDKWSCKVTLYELSAMTLAKSNLVTYTGDLAEYNINEEDRAKYQPSCVMFRRSIENRQLSRMPYDRAVIFKNKTFSTNIEGKNIRLLGAPSVVTSEREIQILLEVVDALTLQSDFVENITPPQ